MSLSGGKSKTKGSQTSSGTSTTTADPASMAEYQRQTGGILDTTTKYTSQPYERFGGKMIAGMDPMQTRAREVAGGNVGVWKGMLDDAEGATKTGLTYDGKDPSAWYNKFESDVIDSLDSTYDEEQARQINQMNDSIAQRGAFGNVSTTLGEAELRRGITRDKAAAISNLKYSGFKDARDAGFRAQEGQYAGAGILGSLAGQRQTMGQADVAMLEELGMGAREIEQLQLDAERAEWDKAAADRLQKVMLELEMRRGVLGALPFGQTTTSSGSGTSSGTSSNTSFSFAPTNWALGPFSSGSGAG